MRNEKIAITQVPATFRRFTSMSGRVLERYILLAELPSAAKARILEARMCRGNMEISRLPVAGAVAGDFCGRPGPVILNTAMMGIAANP
jgi:hypothetical protein